MKRTVNINTWKRKAHFEFFKNFEEPFFGVTVNVDVTRAYRYCKANNHSFFLYYLYQSARACNSTDAFRLRIEEDGSVVEYDVVHPGCTILRPDETFGFAHFRFADTFEAFEQAAKDEISYVQQEAGLDTSRSTPDYIHYSSTPWFTFTALTHARSFSHKGSEPKITFGKIFEQADQLMMPVSINGHHALMDGVDVGKHLDWFQDFLNEH